MSLLRKGRLFLAGAVLLISMIVFRRFIFFGDLYLYNDIGSDTYNSYLPYVTYLSKMIYSGDFSFWSFNIALGTNLFSTNPVLTDPFNILLSLAGPSNVAYLLPYVAIMKILIAALGFYNYLTYRKFSIKTAVVVSTLYGFNGYIILWGQHYHMGTIIVLIPFLLLGIEKYWAEGKKAIFVMSIFILAFCGYYFLYMFAIFFVMYCLVRYFELYKFSFKSFLKFMVDIFLYSVLGIALAALVLLPSVYVAINNPRLSGSFIGNNIFELASITDYITMIMRAFSNDTLGTGSQFYGLWNYYEAPILYSGVLTFVLIPTFFLYASKKEKMIYGLLFSSLIVFLAFPFFSQFFNAFSANSYRWTFVIIVFNSIVSAKGLDGIFMNLKGKVNKISNLYTLALLYFIAFVSFGALLIGNELLGLSPFFTHSFKHLLLSFFLIFIYLLLTRLGLDKKHVIILFSLIIFVELSAFSSFTVNNRGVVSKTEFSHKQGYNDYTLEAIDYLKKTDTDFFRIDKSFNSVFLSDSLMQNYFGVKSYNSLNTPSYLEFLREVGIPFKIMNHPNYITGLNNETTLSRLFGVKYLIASSNSLIPIGYEKKRDVESLSIYEDKYSMPLGVGYDSYITWEEYIELNTAEKIEALTKAYVEKESNSVSKYKKYRLVKENGVEEKIEPIVTPVNLSINSGVITDKEFIVTAITEDPQLLLNLIQKRNQRIKIHFELESPVNSVGQIFAGNDSGFFEENSKSFNVNVGENVIEETIDLQDVSQIRIDIAGAIGTYKIKNFEMSYTSNSQIDSLQKLKENALEIQKFKSDVIEGEISVSKPTKLVLSIPFDEGWSAEVNGKSVDIDEVNIGFIGIDLLPGTSNVKLEYMPPWFKVGLIVSFVSLLILITPFFKKRYLKWREKWELEKKVER